MRITIEHKIDNDTIKLRYEVVFIGKVETYYIIVRPLFNPLSLVYSNMLQDTLDTTNGKIVRSIVTEIIDSEVGLLPEDFATEVVEMDTVNSLFVQMLKNAYWTYDKLYTKGVYYETDKWKMARDMITESDCFLDTTVFREETLRRIDHALSEGAHDVARHTKLKHLELVHNQSMYESILYSTALTHIDTNNCLQLVDVPVGEIERQTMTQLPYFQHNRTVNMNKIHKILTFIHELEEK